MMPNTITFQTTDNTWVMRITADRRIEVNEDVEVTEAAQKVLDTMQYFLLQQRTWVGLTPTDWLEALKDIDPETKRLPQGFSLFACAIEAKLKEKNYE